MSDQIVQFYRNFRAFSGGHLKVWHYFNHVRAAPGFEPKIYFEPGSRWDSTNPWHKETESVDPDWNPERANIWFVGGMDWLRLPQTSTTASWRPIINLVQHVRHADPQDKRHRFLRHRAIRICVSEQVAAAILETGQVNGPVFTIPNGIDFEAVRKAKSEQRDIDLLIVGLKQRRLARRVARRLALTNWRKRRKLFPRVKVIEKKMPRGSFLGLLGRARTTLFLPNTTEGFYLPALEGMAAGTLVICPDCIGNRGFCLHRYNCMRPAYTLDEIEAALAASAQLSSAERKNFLGNASSTVPGYSLKAERQAFQDILMRVPET